MNFSQAFSCHAADRARAMLSRTTCQRSIVALATRLVRVIVSSRDASKQGRRLVDGLLSSCFQVSVDSPVPHRVSSRGGAHHELRRSGEHAC